MKKSEFLYQRDFKDPIYKMIAKLYKITVKYPGMEESGLWHNIIGCLEFLEQAILKIFETMISCEILKQQSEEMEGV